MNRICTIPVLGAGWTLYFCEFEEDPWFKKNESNGKCVPSLRKIAFTNPHTDPRTEFESDEEMLADMHILLKHELVHAFLLEAGLDNNSLQSPGAWPDNEEMVEFFAVQLEKIHVAVDGAWQYMREWLMEPKKEMHNESTFHAPVGETCEQVAETIREARKEMVIGV